MSSNKSDETSPSFNLTSTSQSFSSRSNDVFASLDVLEQKHNAFQKTQDSSETLEHAGVMKCDPVGDAEAEGRDREQGRYGDRHWRRRNDRQMERHSDRQMGRHSLKQNRSSHSDRWSRGRTQMPWKSNSEQNVPKDGFRRPGPVRSKKAPDFKVHPEKWTCYSLDDVSEKDMSDKANKRAALDFLFERKNERERLERLAAGLPEEEEKFESETAACSKGLISFSKNKSKREAKMEIDEGKKFTGIPKDDVYGDRFEDSYTEEGQESSSQKTIELVNTSSIPDVSKNDEKIDTMSVSNQDKDKDIDTLEVGSEPVVTFKSRKNVRKHIRRRGDDDDASTGV